VKLAPLVQSAVAIETPSQLVDFERVRTCLSQICASEGEFDRFFSEVFEQLDCLSNQLLRRQQAWQTERSEAEGEYRKRWEQFAAHQAEVAAQEAQLHQAGPPPADDPDDDRLQQALDQIEQERARLVVAVEDAQKQAAELAQATAELVQTRKQFEELLAPASAAGPAGALETAQQKLTEMQRERVLLEQERASLEAELESVRNRAAEMSETLAQQKREMGEERAQWAEELKRQRRLLESLSAQQAPPARNSNVPPSPASETPSPAKTGTPESDPVLDSVMAQFELLQKDLARRRKQQATNSG